MYIFTCSLCKEKIQPNQNIYYANDCKYCSISCRYNAICKNGVENSDIENNVKHYYPAKSYNNLSNLETVTCYADKKNKYPQPNYSSYINYTIYDNYSTYDICKTYLKYSLSLIVFIYNSSYMYYK